MDPTCRFAPEDPNIRADIFVPQPPYALEVQLRPTQFERRTASRTAKGADTIWFVGHDVDYNDELVKRAMWRLPSARVKVYDRRRTWAGRPPEFEPWTDEADTCGGTR